jgi:hypothetical protein
VRNEHIGKEGRHETSTACVQHGFEHHTGLYNLELEGGEMKRLVAILWVLLLCLSLYAQGGMQPGPGMPASGGGGGGSFAHWRSITVDNAKVPNTDQTDFPVAIFSTVADLKTTGNGGDVTDAEGDDIVFFTNSDCSTGQLKFERESYDPATGAIVYFVKITLTTAADTVFYMCYGNSSITSFQGDPTNAWNAEFDGLWHITTLNDSTSNARHLTATGSPVTAAALLGNGYDFESGSTQYLSVSSVPTTAADNWSLEVVYKPENSSFNGAIVQNGTEPSGGWALAQSDGACTNPNNRPTMIFVGVACADASNSGASTFSAGTTYYMALRRISGAETLWKGTADTGWGGSASTPNAPTGSFSIGGCIGCGGNYPADGIIDEVRIATPARSTDWITTTSNNLNDPGTFYTIGSEN